VVGADRLTDPTSGNQYYTVRVRLVQAALDKWKRLAGVKLYPGMPVQALIIKGERRAIDYFIEPITDTFWRAFREK
jgi:multidrug efflux pump subunit AcrA (membrane-fusion protein)